MTRASRPSFTRDFDLVVVGLWAVLAASLGFVPGAPAALGLAVGIPFVLCGPGYALVSALFPRVGDVNPRGGTTSWVGRLGLSLGGSVVAVGVVAGALDFTVWGFGRTSVVVGVAAVTLLALVVARVRRGRLAPEHRVAVPSNAARGWLGTVVVGDGVVGVVLTLVVVAVAVGAVGVVAEDATSQATSVELFVLGTDESGTLLAGEHPSNLTRGSPATFTVGVGVSGVRPVDGRVVGRLERVVDSERGLRIRDAQEVATFDVRAVPGERTLVEHTVTPSMTGERLRLRYRFYPDDRSEPTRSVHVWVAVATE